MSEKILFVTFNSAPWNISATIEIISREIKSNSRIEWLILDRIYPNSQELPISSKLRSIEIRKKLKKILLDNPSLANQVKICYSLPVTDKIYDYGSRSKEVAYAELISRSRDSNPCIEHNLNKLVTYQKTYMLLRTAIKEKLRQNNFSKIYLFNGRPLYERAVNDECLARAQRIFYFETFNENWKDRYFIFEEPTHSSRYRSKVMHNFSKQSRQHDEKLFEYNALKWFEDRRLGKTQAYTKNQKYFEPHEFKKPYYVFFHSSQDELDMVGLTSKKWGNQFDALKTLVEIFEKQKMFNLVLRIHPHLLHKAKNEQARWEEFGLDLEKMYSWFKYVPSNSPINSYKLIESSRGVITSGSTVGVEAAYLQKQSILLGKAFHEFMGITANPNTKKDLAVLLKYGINKATIKKSFNASLDYGYFSETGGIEFEVTKYDEINRQYSFNSIILSPIWYVALFRRIEQHFVRIKTRYKLRRCSNDCRFNSGEGWK